MKMFDDLLLPFIAVCLAELGDKTQLAVYYMSSKTKRYMSLFLGVMCAFILADGLAVALGWIISKFIPQIVLNIIAGIVFVILGVIIFRRKEEKNQWDFKDTFISAFSLIFISELGDKTQITSALFATKFNPVMVFIGMMLALALLSVSAILVGNIIANRINKKTVSIGAGLLFIGVGISCFF